MSNKKAQTEELIKRYTIEELKDYRCDIPNTNCPFKQGMNCMFSRLERILFSFKCD